MSYEAAIASAGETMPPLPNPSSSPKRMLQQIGTPGSCQNASIPDSS
jgi:hypothetical protein